MLKPLLSVGFGGWVLVFDGLLLLIFLCVLFTMANICNGHCSHGLLVKGMVFLIYGHLGTGLLSYGQLSLWLF